MAAPTVTDVLNGIKSRLNEAVNTPAGALESGTGGIPILATDDVLIKYINEAKNDLCRNAIAVEEQGQVANLPAGSRIVNYSALDTTTNGSGGLIWAALRNGVRYGTTILQQSSRSQVELYYPNGPYDPNGVPAYFVDNSPQGVMIAPKNTASNLTLTVYGLSTPADYTLSAPTAQITWLEPDNVRLLEFYGATKLAKKNAEDQSLAERAPIWEAEYEAGKLALQLRMLRQAPDMVAQYFPQAIAALRGGQAPARGKG